MGVLIHPKRWTEKPPLGVQLDRGHPLAKDLRMLYVMNEGGGLVCKDLSERTGDGVFSATVPPIWIGGQHGPLLNFDGARIDSARNLVLGANFSVACLNTAATGVNGNFRALVETSFSTGFYLGGDSADPPSNYNFIVNSNFMNPSGPPIAFAPEFKMVVATLLGASASIYAPGYAETKTLAGGVGATDKPVAIGWPLVANNPWRGKIALTAVWDRALSPAEVQWFIAEPYAMLVPQSPRVRYFIPPAAAPGGRNRVIIANALPLPVQMGALGLSWLIRRRIQLAPRKKKP